MKNITLLVILLFLSVYWSACNKGSSPSPPATALAVNSISPSSGGLNTIVTVTGKGFSPDPASNTVTINDQKAVVLTANETVLTIRVTLTGSTGPVTVKVNGQSAAGPVFTFLSAAIVSTIAGNGIYDSLSAASTISPVNHPLDVAVDKNGTVYYTEYNRVKKMTPAGEITVLAGNGVRTYADGSGTAASFDIPVALAVDGSGNVFVADRDNNCIRKISPAGLVTTFAGKGRVYGYADGKGSDVRFWEPTGIAVDKTGNVYVSDRSNERIRKITPDGTVSTLAGDGKSGYRDGAGANAQFYHPARIAADSAGNIYVADEINHRIRIVTPAGIVSTLAGSGISSYQNGVGQAADFGNVRAVAVDRLGNVYVNDQSNKVIRKITPAGNVTHVAGVPQVSGFADGAGTTAKFYFPEGIATDGAGNVYVADEINNRIRKISF